MGQAVPAFPKPTLAGPDPWLSCTCHLMALKEICSVTFPSIKIRLTAPWILFPAPLRDGCDICLLPVGWDLPSQPGLWVTGGRWQSERFQQDPQCLWVDPIQPHRGGPGLRELHSTPHSFQLWGLATNRTIGVTAAKAPSISAFSSCFVVMFCLPSNKR